ncbi:MULTISPECIES: cytochrome c oxidase subunit 2A [Paenibacillus]|uniref:Cytochrome c oxidase subunit 2A n=1 Tax=Paenibacillus radicis (ex Xue et al. 2023) TaxID=2972489 RepID=A0ABT1YCN5_9BACL|nr:cytochrome c oxidase subunit 2A [Paenibacillus radicis (ex Xue et al. 2023)]MCR8629730.1 cytochrome c oxidase subunit 2A [Paenibacillus radicis (ex Xue et al. 2023)]
MGEQHRQEDSSLKGTLVAVMLLGAFLVLTWVGVFVLFIARS